ncbi:MAG: hypothetical protein K8S94_07430 [Planctomycetia bacterium]|nr:hypothetical protein [Planctomycetia bacterium]
MWPWALLGTAGCLATAKHSLNYPATSSFSRSAQAVEGLLHEWAHALAWNYSVDRLAGLPGLDPVAFERACRDEAWGCAYSRVWRAYLEVIREAA